MSRHNDIRDQQINDKKRSRYNREDDEDDGEIREGDVDLDHPGINSSKRLRPTASVFESHYDNQNKNVFAVTNDMSGSNKDFNINAYTKRSREELERERQIRMAALRGGTDVDTAVVTTTSSMSGITQQSMKTSSTTTHQNNKSKLEKKKALNRTNEDALNDHGKSTKGDINNDYSEEEGTDDDDDDDEDRLEEESDDKKMMEAFFGIRQFGSTKNTKVVTNHTSAAVGTVAKHLKPRKYRQYMNRKNGFNRPLDNV